VTFLRSSISSKTHVQIAADLLWFVQLLPNIGIMPIVQPKHWGVRDSYVIEVLHRLGPDVATTNQRCLVPECLEMLGENCLFVVWIVVIYLLFEVCSGKDWSVSVKRSHFSFSLF